MVSTPSRSRQATRISLPDIVGPSSTVLPARAFLLISVVLLICLLRLRLAAAGAQKSPRPSASRGLLSKLSLPSTSAYGVANYDDGQQSYLSNVHYHGREYSKIAQGSQAPVSFKQSSVASLRFRTACSTVRPWLVVPVSGLNATSHRADSPG